MAKSRRYGSTHHERLMGSYGYGSVQRAASAGDLPELLEEEVWSMVDRMVERENSEERRHGLGGKDDDGQGQVGGLSLAFQENGRASARIIRHFHDNGMPPGPLQVATSAPMNVPRWPKGMVGIDSGESLGHHEKPEGDDEDDGDWMPPHEYLAREYAQGRRKAAVTSVFEGVGRTLKGRDMSRVRDAVWSRTGFYG